MLTYLANFAYLLTLFSLIMRDMLRLRSLMAISQCIIIVYAWQRGIWVTSGWNAVFLGINVFMVAQILRERRRVALPAELQALHERHFAALSPPEFLRWWRQGHRERLTNTSLARTGQHPDSLYFLLNGSVRVSREGEVIAELPSGYFVAEMSLLTGEPANADVVAAGEIEVVRWNARDLRALRQRNPSLWTKIQSVIGHDLVEKIRRGEDHVPAPVYGAPEAALVPALR